MQDKLKKAAARAQKFAEDHRTGIAVAATIVVMGALNRLALRDHDDFLREHDLYDAFYYPEDDNDEE